MFDNFNDVNLKKLSISIIYFYNYTKEFKHYLQKNMSNNMIYKELKKQLQHKSEWIKINCQKN